MTNNSYIYGTNQANLIERDQLFAILERVIDDKDVLAQVKQALVLLVDIQFALSVSSIVALTDAKGKILYVNDKFVEISQYSEEELIGQDHRIINSGYHSKAFFQEFWATISSGQVWHGEIKNRAKDGTYYWVNTTIVPFLDAEQKPYQYLAIRNEVTRLKETEQQLKNMMVQVMDVQEQERKRISRELHDGLGQSLFSLMIQLDRLSADHAHIEDLHILRQHVSTMMSDVRNMAWELRPSVLDDLGVEPAIKTYIDNYVEHFGIEVKRTGRLQRRLTPTQETVMYRVLQESLTNVAKYASVDEVEVLIENTDEGISLTVKDNGVGFNLDKLDRRGVGLFSMEERAVSVGGKLFIWSEAGKGTQVKLLFPKDVV